MTRARFVAVLTCALAGGAGMLLAIAFDLFGARDEMESAMLGTAALGSAVFFAARWLTMAAIFGLVVWAASVPLWVWGLVARYRMRVRRRVWPLLAGILGLLALTIQACTAVVIAGAVGPAEQNPFAPVEEIMATVQEEAMLFRALHLTGLGCFGLLLISVIALLVMTVEALRRTTLVAPETVFE